MQSSVHGGFAGYDKDVEELCEQGRKSRCGHQLGQYKRNLTLKAFTHLNHTSGRQENCRVATYPS